VAGTLRGNCVALDLQSGDDLTVTGTIDNRCTDPARTGQPLRLSSLNGALSFTNAVVVSSGDVTIWNGDAPFPFPSTPRLANSGTLNSHAPAEDCSYLGSTLGNAGVAPAGQPGSPRGADGDQGSSVFFTCEGRTTFRSTRVTTGAGGAGGEGLSTPTQPAQGGHGGPPGTITIFSHVGLVFQAPATGAERNVFRIQPGGRGGDAFGGPGTKAGPGSLASATGGNGNEPQQERLNTITGSTTVESGALLFIINEATPGNDESAMKRGGDAFARAADGADATGASPATPGREAEARGGRGGNTNRAYRIVDDLFSTPAAIGLQNMELVVGAAGRGGDADAQGGKGGNGSQQSKPGAAGGRTFALGGTGGDATINDNRTSVSKYPGGPGPGGRLILERAQGGMGFVDCKKFPFEPGGDGGPGGPVEGNPGFSGTDGTLGVPLAADLYLTSLANGGDGGRGAGPGNGGLAGGRIQFNTRGGVEHHAGKTFTKGADGPLCVLTFATAITKGTDPANHFNFVLLQNVGSLALTFQLANRAQVTGPGPWQPITVDVAVNGTVTGTGIGTYAGFPNVQARISGQLVFNAAGDVAGFTGTIEVGSRGELPTGQSITYNISGTLQGAPAPRVGRQHR
jgi:hypothetical protein